MNAIAIRNLTKHFRKQRVSRNHTTLKSEMLALLRRQRRVAEPGYTEVLKNINLTIATGRTFGIVGRNGSGKSTLLKIITGIYGPTSGTVEVNGRLSALLELGAGFHPEFSGRENILINGIILGLSRAQIKSRMSEIIRFSELGEFVDQPVRTYSSGMYMRLAFAVATHVDPDVLIVDEILAVGDEHFARKSLAKMTEFKERGKTIVLVTHDLGTVQRWCDEAAWLERGEILAVGKPDDVVESYRRTIAEEEMITVSAPPETSEEGQPVANDDVPGNRKPELPRPQTGPMVEPNRRWGNFQVEIPAVRVLGEDGKEKTVFRPEEPMSLEIDFIAKREVVDAVFGIGIFQPDGLRVYGTNTLVDRVDLPRPLPSRGTVVFEIGRLGFIDGNYAIDVACHNEREEFYDNQHLLYQFAVRSNIRDVGIARPPHSWRLKLDANPFGETQSIRGLQEEQA